MKSPWSGQWVVRSKAEVVDCRKRTMPLPSERFLAVGSRSELGMDEEVQPGDYSSAPLRVRGVLPILAWFA